MALNHTICFFFRKPRENLGKIRFSIRLDEERVLPSECYEPLIEVFEDAVDAEKVCAELTERVICCKHTSCSESFHLLEIPFILSLRHSF